MERFYQWSPLEESPATGPKTTSYSLEYWLRLFALNPEANARTERIRLWEPTKQDAKMFDNHEVEAFHTLIQRELLSRFGTLENQTPRIGDYPHVLRQLASGIQTTFRRSLVAFAAEALNKMGLFATFRSMEFLLKLLEESQRQLDVALQDTYLQAKMKFGSSFLIWLRAQRNQLSGLNRRNELDTYIQNMVAFTRQLRTESVLVILGETAEAFIQITHQMIKQLNPWRDVLLESPLALTRQIEANTYWIPDHAPADGRHTLQDPQWIESQYKNEVLNTGAVSEVLDTIRWTFAPNDDPESLGIKLRLLVDNQPIEIRNGEDWANENYQRWQTHIRAVFEKRTTRLHFWAYCTSPHAELAHPSSLIVALNSEQTTLRFAPEGNFSPQKDQIEVLFPDLPLHERGAFSNAQRNVMQQITRGLPTPQTTKVLAQHSHLVAYKPLAELIGVPTLVAYREGQRSYGKMPDRQRFFVLAGEVNAARCEGEIESRFGLSRFRLPMRLVSALEKPTYAHLFLWLEIMNMIDRRPYGDLNNYALLLPDEFGIEDGTWWLLHKPAPEPSYVEAFVRFCLAGDLPLPQGTPFSGHTAPLPYAILQDIQTTYILDSVNARAQQPFTPVDDRLELGICDMLNYLLPTTYRDEAQHIGVTVSYLMGFQRNCLETLGTPPTRPNELEALMMTFVGLTDLLVHKQYIQLRQLARNT